MTKQPTPTPEEVQRDIEKIFTEKIIPEWQEFDRLVKVIKR